MQFERSKMKDQKNTQNNNERVEYKMILKKKTLYRQIETLSIKLSLLAIILITFIIPCCM